MLSIRRNGRQSRAAANDNSPKVRQVVHSINSQQEIAQEEIEVFDALMADYSGVAANDNDVPPARKAA